MVENLSWFVACEGNPEGPFSLRDLDVKFRTSELASNVLMWQEGMESWEQAFKIP